MTHNTNFEQVSDELHKILDSAPEAKTALEAIKAAAAATRWGLERVSSAYKMYLLSGRKPYTPEELTDVAINTEKANRSIGRELFSLEDALLHPLPV